MAQVVRSPRAEEDLQEIWLYIAADNVDAADRVLDDLATKLLNLAEHPQMGASRPDIAPDVRLLPVGNFLVLYRIHGHTVDVVRIVRGGRNLIDLL
jgi:toxin ParE1/3/4